MKQRNGPEAQIQHQLCLLLKNKGWYVRETHGNIYQTGFPDLFACSRRHGFRWVEVKTPTRHGVSAFTPAQMEVFPRFSAEGIGIWILTAATEFEYNKLFRPPNWYQLLMD